MGELRVEIFKHIVFHLKEWYCQYHNLNDSEFIIKNDLSILKIIKLDFLVTAINSHKDNSILTESNYFALPYGPVETSIYNLLRSNSIDGLNFNRIKLNNFSNTLPNLDENLKNSIINSVKILKDNEPHLINLDAGSLVDLTHKWQSWKRNYSLARKLGRYSFPIPNSEIENDIKIMTINIIS